MKSIFLLFVASFFALNTAFAQHKSVGGKQAAAKSVNDNTVSMDSSGTLDVVTMHDGKRWIGKILSLDAQTLTIQVSGEAKPMELSRLMVAGIETTDTESVKFGLTNSFAPSLLVNNTGFMIAKGKGVYQTLDFVSHHFDYGVSNNVTITAGVDLFYFTGQIKFGGKIAKNANASLTVGGAVPLIGSLTTTTSPNGTSTASGSGVSITSAVAALTFGSSNSFLNVGGGVAGIFNTTNVYNSSGTTTPVNNSLFIPVVHFGGFHRLSQSWSIMSDNTIVVFNTNPNSVGYAQLPLFVPTLGARYFAGKKTALDFGLTRFGFTSSYSSNPYGGSPNTVTTITSYIILPYFALKATL